MSGEDFSSPLARLRQRDVPVAADRDPVALSAEG